MEVWEALEVAVETQGEFSCRRGMKPVGRLDWRSV